MSCFRGLKKEGHVEEIDVALVGGGVMSATMATLLQAAEPSWKIRIFERLGAVGEESTNGWNNAGTGHAALCEPNYTPYGPDGKTICPNKAITINEQFNQSLQFYSSMVAREELQQDFLCTTPHVTFVRGEKDIAWLQERYRVLKDQPLFHGMEYSEDPEVIKQWSPLLVDGRDSNEKIACTYVKDGTDIDYGALTRGMVYNFENKGGKCLLYHSVTNLKKQSDGSWMVRVSKRDIDTGFTDYKAKFVFVGGGGWSLPILQNAGIPEIKGFAGFPISGEFLVCQKPEVVEKHNIKAYGKAAVGAPPMSVPHLDARVIDGNRMLLFGPCAGFSPRFLKTGGMMDLIKSIKWHNLIPMTVAGLANLDLCVYLAKELLASKNKRLRSLREFCPEAKGEDWTLITAGQRVQVMKKDPVKVGVLQFGTEVVAAEDGSICGLLGASPGASIAVSVALDALNKCFASQFKSGEWESRIKTLVPSYGMKLNEDAELAAKYREMYANILGIGRDV